MKIQRASGVLLHITSLPSNFGIGDLGPSSYSFVNLMASANQHYWSILPLTPTSLSMDSSPYQPISAFAGNTLMISPEKLVEDDLLTKQYAATLKLPHGTVNFNQVTLTKNEMLKKAFQNFTEKKLHAEFDEFCSENKNWLDDYALFKALSKKTNLPWYRWKKELRNRNPKAIKKEKNALQKLTTQEKFEQYVFQKQWKSLRKQCQTKNIKIIGDIPFYVSYNSADIWSNQELFKLDSNNRPKFVSGVPPDYFSKNGQLWGNPVYNWSEAEKSSFNWWISRIKRALTFCDIVRLDHFRGFTAYWQVPASHRTARRGHWIRASSKLFHENLKKSFPTLPFIAEDLGSITTHVKKNLRTLGIPGMRVLLFAFNGSPRNPHLPPNHPKNAVVFTGTHDTNTSRGWFIEETNPKQRKALFRTVGKEIGADEISWEMINLAFSSKSDLSIVPMQDFLSLGSEARMNCPAQTRNNWSWRLSPQTIEKMPIQRLVDTTEMYSR